MKDRTQFRQARPEDIERIMEIIRQAQEQMRLAGSMQWQDGYPAVGNISSDIEKGYGYVFSLDERVITYGAVILFDGEAAYEEIDGQWLNDNPYVVVHRLAVANEMKRRGMAVFFMEKVEELSLQHGIHDFRVDTNYDNYYMHKIMDRMGFTYCGIIQYPSGSRWAYHKEL